MPAAAKSTVRDPKSLPSSRADYRHPTILPRETDVTDLPFDSSTRAGGCVAHCWRLAIAGCISAPAIALLLECDGVIFAHSNQGSSVLCPALMALGTSHFYALGSGVGPRLHAVVGAIL
jgi:hypothetical protein